MIAFAPAAMMIAAAAAPDRIEHRPQSGFQQRFLSTPADIAIGGGAAGAGKSYALTLEGLRHHDVPGFSAIYFRRTSPELQGAGSLWEEMSGIYPLHDGEPRLSPTLSWRFENGATIQLSHLQYAKDVTAHQSKGYCLIIFDEFTHFEEAQFWYMLSRNRSTCGVKPYIRATTNPDPDSFVATFIAWWIDQDTGYPIPERDGVLRWMIRDGDEISWADSPEALRVKHPHIPNEDFDPKSVTFIAGRLEDNPALTSKDPGYRGRLNLLPKVERERLLGGNWKIKPAAGLYFQPEYFEIVDRLPDDLVEQIRFWDKAATEPSTANPDPDWSVGAKMAFYGDGRIALPHVARFRLSPGRVDVRMKMNARRDGKDVRIGAYRDPGQAGKVDKEHMHRVLKGYNLTCVRETPGRGKTVKAGPWSSHAEKSGVLLLRGDWNEAYITEHHRFGDPTAKDDQVDASSGAFNLHYSDGVFFA